MRRNTGAYEKNMMLAHFYTRFRELIEKLPPLPHKGIGRKPGLRRGPLNS